MTNSQPNAPAQPQAPAAPRAGTEVPADLADRIDAANRAVERAARRAEARAAAVQQQAPATGRPRDVSVTKNAEGYIVVTGPTGTVRYDPKVGLDQDAVQNLVQTALQPPRAPAQPWEKGPPEAVAVVAIVFFCLLLITLVISAARVLTRRAAAGAGAQHLPPDLAPRLARIEQAIEAVAIEVERISESERYSARLLTERLPAAANGQPAATPTADVVR